MQATSPGSAAGASGHVGGRGCTAMKALTLNQAFAWLCCVILLAVLLGAGLGWRLRGEVAVERGAYVTIRVSEQEVEQWIEERRNELEAEGLPIQAAHRDEAYRILWTWLTTREDPSRWRRSRSL